MVTQNEQGGEVDDRFGGEDLTNMILILGVINPQICSSLRDTRGVPIISPYKHG